MLRSELYEKIPPFFYSSSFNAGWRGAKLAAD